MPLGIDSNTRFSEVYSQFKTEQDGAIATNYSKAKHLRFQDGKGLYFRKGMRTPESWFKRAATLATRRETRRGDAGQRIWQAIANEYSPAKADQVFRDVLGHEPDGIGNRDYQRAQVTLGQLDQIKQRLDGIDANLDPFIDEAAALHNSPSSDGFEQFTAEHSELLLSGDYLKSMPAKLAQDLVRANIAFDAYDRLTNGDPLEDYERQHLTQTFLKAIGDNPNDPPMPQSGAALKTWMVERLEQRFVDPSGQYELNFGDDNDIDVKRFKQQVAQPNQDPDQKFALMRGGIRHRILDHGDTVKDYSKNITKALLSMKHPQGTDSQDLDSFYQGTIKRAAGRGAGDIRGQRLNQARQLADRYLPGTGNFARIAKQFGLDPQHLTQPERNYITARLRGLVQGHAMTNLASERAGKNVIEPLNEHRVEKQLKKILTELDGDENQRLTHQRGKAALKTVSDRLATQPIPGRDLIDHIALANDIHPNRIPDNGREYITDQINRRALQQAARVGQDNIDNDWVDQQVRELVTLVANHPQVVEQAPPAPLRDPRDIEPPQSLLDCNEQASHAADQAIRDLLDPRTDPADLVKSLYHVADLSRAYTDRRFKARGSDDKPADDDYSTDLAHFLEQASRHSPAVAKRYRELMGPDGRGRALLFASTLVANDGQMMNPQRNFVGDHQTREQENLELNKLSRTLNIALSSVALAAGSDDPSEHIAGIPRLGDEFGAERQQLHGNPLTFDTTGQDIPGATLRAAGLNSDKHIRALLGPMRDQVTQRANRQRELNPAPERNRDRIDSNVSVMSDVDVNAGWKDPNKARRND